jgi:WD40 repeat protein
MADIFISHSGGDNEIAAAIGERIRRQRPSWSLFYDKDNIRAGQRWQERLREELTSCRVVLALLSRNWLGSPWCFTEAVTAGFRGKDVVGIETEDLSGDDLARAPPILHERQRVRLRDGDDRAWREILEALDRSGLDPDDWFPIPPNVGPYPGLVAFDEKDAGVFFGRKQEITEYLGILDTLRGPDRSQVLVISGGSGSGKSSLLRAGLIPRLRRKPEWVVIGPFEVAREPVRNLFDRLGEALAGLGLPVEGLNLSRPPADPDTLAETLDETIRRLEQATGAWVLVPLDQAEALLVGDRQASGPTWLLLGALAQLLARRTRHAVLAATIRTEFVPRLEAAFAGPDIRLRQAPLSALGSLAEVVEKPAERFGIELEAGLSEQIVADVHSAEALPLLAYTLKELHDRGGGDRHLTLDEYRTLGGVQGAIAAKLEAVLSDPEPTAEEAQALHRAFTRYLIRVDEGAVEGERLLRRVVPRTSLPRSADRVIGRLVDGGLLTTKDGTIELAHERLINDWRKLPLKTWLAQGAADRRLIDQLRPRVDDPTLPDGLLAQAEALLQREHELATEEPGLARLVQRSKDQKRAREWRRRILLGGALLVATVFAVVAWFAWLQRSEAINQTQLADAAAKQARVERDKARSQLLAIEARRADAEATSPDDIARAGALALESIEIARKGNPPRPTEADAMEVARRALIRLPIGVLSHGSSVRSLAVLADGRLASAGKGGEIKLWPKDGAGEPEIYSHGSEVSSLAVLADGRLASGGLDGNIKLWPKSGVGDPEVRSHGSPIWSLVSLADGRLASGGLDGKIKLWPKNGAGDPEVLSHWAPVMDITGQMMDLPDGVSSLAVSVDGRLVSAGEDRKIKLWPKGGTGEPEVRSQGSLVSSLVVLADGRLVSAGSSVKLWPEDGTGESEDLSPGGLILSLAVLADGGLALGGKDGTIVLRPMDRGGEPVLLSHGSPVLSLAVLADGRLASAGEDGKIKLWPKDGRGEPQVLLSHGWVGSIAVQADGRLASGGLDGEIELWPKDGSGNPEIRSHGDLIWSLAVLADGRLASAGEDGKIKLWPKDGTGEPKIRLHGSGVSSLAVLADGRLASASAGKEGQIKIWPKDGAGEPEVRSHGGGVSSLAVLADGRLASASAGEEGQIKIWPKEGTGEPEVRSHGSGVSSLAVLADGRLASASAGEEGNIKIWSKDGAGEPEVRSHGRGVRSMAVLADGRLASGGEDGKIKLWPKDGMGEPVVLLHGSRVFSLAALADGRLASGDYDGKIKLWIVDEEKLVAALCLRAGRNLTKDEWARYIGSDTPRQPSCRDRPSNWRTPDS